MNSNSQACGKLFSVPAVGKYVVFLSTREQVEEASKAPIDQLSFNAAIDEVGSAAHRNDLSKLKWASFSNFCHTSFSMGSNLTQRTLGIAFP